MYALVLINLWHVLGLFLGNLVMYLLRSHAIVVAKSCEGVVRWLVVGWFGF